MNNKTTISLLQKKKDTGEKIIMLTAYDYPFAFLLAKSGVDIILVSDALAMVGLGHKNTLGLSVENIIHHTQAVLKGAPSCLVIANMPFGSYANEEKAKENAFRLVKDGGAHGVEIEGDLEIKPTVKAVVDAGVPVMAHIGLTREKTLKTGNFKVQGKDADSAKKILNTAAELEQAGAFALLLECVPDRVAELITQKVKIPVIGVGAGVHCDGQGLVTQDMFNLFEDFVPKFVKQYADLSKQISTALNNFKQEVRENKFPTSSHGFKMKDEEFRKLKQIIQEEKQ